MPERKSAPTRPPTPPRKMPGERGGVRPHLRRDDGEQRGVERRREHRHDRATPTPNSATISQNHGDRPPERDEHDGDREQDAGEAERRSPGPRGTAASPRRPNSASATIETAAVKAKNRPRPPGPRFQRSSRKKKRNVWYGIEQHAEAPRSETSSRRTVGISIRRRTISKKPSVTSAVDVGRRPCAYPSRARRTDVADALGVPAAEAGVAQTHGQRAMAASDTTPRITNTPRQVKPSIAGEERNGERRDARCRRQSTPGSR